MLTAEIAEIAEFFKMVFYVRSVISVVEIFIQWFLRVLCMLCIKLKIFSRRSPW
jgi:hypothetical protein